MKISCPYEYTRKKKSRSRRGSAWMTHFLISSFEKTKKIWIHRTGLCLEESFEHLARIRRVCLEEVHEGSNRIFENRQELGGWDHFFFTFICFCVFWGQWCREREREVSTWESLKDRQWGKGDRCVATSELRNLEQLWRRNPLPSEDLGPPTALIRLIFYESLQEDLELLELLSYPCGARRAFAVWSLGNPSPEVGVIPVKSFPCEANLRHISTLQFLIRIPASPVLVCCKYVSYPLRGWSWLELHRSKQFWKLRYTWSCQSVNQICWERMWEMHDEWPVSVSFCALILSKNIISSSYLRNKVYVSQLEELLRDEEEKGHSVSESLKIVELLHSIELLDVDAPVREPPNVSSSSCNLLLSTEWVRSTMKSFSFFDNSCCFSSSFLWSASPPVSSSVINSIGNINRRLYASNK